MTATRNDPEWDDLVRSMTARAALVAAASGAEPYGKAVAAIQRRHPGVAVPDFGGLLGHLLGDVVYRGWAFDPALPVLSAVFHSKDGNRPGPGYDELVRHERLERPEIEPEWTDELTRCHVYFRANRRALPQLLRDVDRMEMTL